MNNIYVKDYGDYKFGAMIFLIIMGSIALTIINSQNAIYLLALLGIYFFSYYGYKLYRYRGIDNWLSTNVVIDSFTVVEKMSPSEYGEDNCFYPNIEYHFVVDKKKIKSSNISLEKKEICFNHKNDLFVFVNKLKTSSCVYYDPKKPHICLLVNSLRNKTRYSYISMMFFGAILALSMVFLMR